MPVGSIIDLMQDMQMVAWFDKAFQSQLGSIRVMASVDLNPLVG